MSERIRHNGIAVFVVVVLHALVIALLWRLPATPAAMSDDETGLRTRFLPRERPITAPGIPALRVPARATRIRAPRSPVTPSASPATRPAQAVEDALFSATPPSAADLLAQGAAWAQAGAPAPDFGRDPLRQRRARLPGGERPGRFVMRHSVTPEQVMAFIGLLFAGPGYDTDPCRRIRSNVEGLKTDLSDQGRERLGWELDEYAFRCMR